MDRTERFYIIEQRLRIRSVVPVHDFLEELNVSIATFKRLSGPPGLRAIKGLHDKALAGEWKGHRSSRLGLQWRVIYRVVTSVLTIQVIQVTPHDYRRP